MGQINKDRDGRMIMRYLSEGQYEQAFNAGRGYCRACGDYQENVDASVEYADCPSCGCPTLFSAAKMGEREVVLQPNSCIAKRNDHHRLRLVRGH
jgi:hypothetical protein